MDTLVLVWIGDVSVITHCFSNYVCCMHFWLESLIGNTTNSTDGRLLLDAHCSTAAAADLTAVTTD